MMPFFTILCFLRVLTAEWLALDWGSGRLRENGGFSVCLWVFDGGVSCSG